MRSNRSSDSSDNEDDAPEVLTLSATKDLSRTQSEAVHAYELAQKAKRKRENRERDAALKAAKAAREEGHLTEETNASMKKRLRSKAKAKAKGKKSEPDLSRGEEMSNAEERMERAMREAAEEPSDVDSVDSFSDEWHGIVDAPPSADTNNREPEEWQGIRDAEEVASPATTKHIPDHFFSVAGTQPTTSMSPSTSLSSKPRKKRQSKAKELIVGSRAIRTLPSAHPDSITASLTRPPARINKFLKRTLKLRKGGSVSDAQKNKNTSSWERRPVNLGVMRHTTGPAMRFARNAAI